MKYNKELLISILLAILTLILMLGCGTRKVDITETEAIHDEIKIENHYSEVIKTVLGTSFTYTPFDGLKPMIVNGVKSENAIISGSTKKEYLKRLLKVQKYNITKTIVIEKTKIIESKNTNLLWIGLFFIFVVAVFAFFYLPRIKISK